MFIGSVITAWILVPICYYTGAWSSDIYPVQSQSLRVKNGSLYPTAAMLTSNYQLNATLFEQVGVPMSKHVMLQFLSSALTIQCTITAQ